MEKFSLSPSHFLSFAPSLLLCLLPLPTLGACRAKQGMELSRGPVKKWIFLPPRCSSSCVSRSSAVAKSARGLEARRELYWMQTFAGSRPLTFQESIGSLGLQWVIGFRSEVQIPCSLLAKLSRLSKTWFQIWAKLGEGASIRKSDSGTGADNPLYFIDQIHLCHVFLSRQGPKVV